MDSEAAVFESPQPEVAEMEKEVVSKLQTPEDPENPPAAHKEMEHLTVNGHGDAEVMDLKETEELIVTENVTLSAETPQMEIEESLSTETCEMESVLHSVMASPDPDESSEKVSEPVAALDTEPENIQPEQPLVPENAPEPLPMQAPLADSVPEPEPEKLAESVPGAELPEQTLPELATLQPSVDVDPPSQEEKISEPPVETTMDTLVEEVAKAVEALTVAETEEDKLTETVLVADVSSEAVALKEEALSEIKTVKPAEDEKEVESKKPVKSDTLKDSEAAATEDESQKNGAELEEDPVPAAGSLSFALLENEQTKETLQTSRTLVILRGLPGSGKSFLARAISEAYKDHCSVISADDHGVKPESPESSADGYKALDEAVVACCGAGTSSSVLVVVDDTNHTQDRLARLGEVAEQQHLVAIFLEPRTKWSRDLAQLTEKTKRGLEDAVVKAMKGSLEEMSLPLYFGWFLLSSVEEKVRCTSMDFLKTLDTLEAFKKHLIDFTGKAEKEVDLEQYFQAKAALHCTTKFCDYGKAEGAKDYAQIPAVEGFYGSVFELSLSALFVTPRTVGGRVSLTEEQLLLWPADAEKELESAVPTAASLPLGSRAHVTLGCAEGVEPVQTGLDLLEIVALQQEGQQGEPVEEMELGSLTYYGEGRWLLNLREPICTPAFFSSFYGRKEAESTKKEPEKKKKQKCTIL